MPLNRLSGLFDRKPRHYKSTSNLSDAAASQNLFAPSNLWKKATSRDRLNTSLEYMTDRNQPPPAQRPVSPLRASTTPTMHPPDELFLKMIRRRSANARLEEQRIRHDHDHIERVSQWSDAMPTPVAVAHALPPQYFDLPPEYESPQQIIAQPPIQTRSTIVRPRDPELFLDDNLKLQIDQAIADFRGFPVTEATPLPTSTPIVDDELVSPINDIDALYLTRRRERRRQTYSDNWR